MKFLLFFLISIFACTRTFCQEFQDCKTAFPVCNKQKYTFHNMDGYGLICDKIGKLRCSNELKETNSIWLRWIIKKSGNLIFDINPIKQDDDLDFVLFKSGDGTCGSMAETRCMASGNNIGELESRNTYCQGSTGLSFQSNDEFESNGCGGSNDNFLKYIEVIKGEVFYLLVNNFDSRHGFSIIYDGSAEFDEIDGCKSYVTDNAFDLADINPNPVVDNLEISINTNKAQSCFIEIYTIDGRLIEKMEISAKKGANKIALKAENLISGNYLMRIIMGDFTSIRQFVKI